MKFNDCGIIINIKKYGEKSFIIKVFTENLGIIRGFVKFGISKKTQQIYQVGNLITLDYVARTEEALGSFINCDLVKNYSSKFIFDKLRLNCAKSTLSMLDEYFLERQSFGNLFFDFNNFLNELSDFSFSNNQLIANYIKLELSILENLGYGVDFSSCVVSNSVVNLAYVSPKSAQAVSFEAGERYAHKLLRLPDFLKINDDENNQKIDNENLLDGLNLSGYFLHKNLVTINNNFKANDNLANNFYRENIIKILKN